MTTSVPTVVPIGKLQLKLARMLELAVEATKHTGDPVHLEDGVKFARGVYEEQLKLAAHRGWLDWDYVNQLGASLDRVEAYLVKARARYDAEKSKPPVDIL